MHQLLTHEDRGLSENVLRTLLRRTPISLTDFKTVQGRNPDQRHHTSTAIVSYDDDDDKHQARWHLGMRNRWTKTKDL